MIYMFNELSLLKVSSREDVCAIMETFINTNITASDAGLDDLRLHEKSLPDLYQLNLYDGYSIDNWLKDNRVSSDLREKFLLITTTSPLINITEEEKYELYSQSEFFSKLDDTSNEVWGLGGAFILDTICISLTTHSAWAKPHIDIRHYFLDENATESISDRVVRHFSNDESLLTHIDWYQACQRQTLKKAAELWDKREDFFPNTEFIPVTEKQIAGISDGRTLTKIINALRKFDTYIKSWEDGDFSYESAALKTGLTITPESESTIQKFGSHRKFKIDGLGRVLFDLHIKLGNTRIHFYPDEQTKKVYIGYIGKHLRIVSEG